MQTQSPDLILSDPSAEFASSAESFDSGSGGKDPSVSSVPPPSCGGIVNALAIGHRLHPHDVALLVASVLGNIAGPHAGFVTPDGILVSAGLNVLLTDQVGASFRDLESALFQPLRARTHFIRSRAACLSRKSIDQWTFGRGDTDNDSSNLRLAPQLQQRFDLLSAFRQKLASVHTLPTHLFDYLCSSDIGLMENEEISPGTLSPGTNQLPSIFSERLDIRLVPQLLKEALHREALLCFPVGGMFSRSDPFDDQQEEQAARLAALMRGQDMSFPSLHRDQGHGSISAARIHLWAGTSVARLGAIVSHPDSHWNDVLHHCLLWNKTECPTLPVPHIPTEKAHSHYRQCLHDLLEIRCHGSHAEQRRLTLPAAATANYRKFKAEIQHHLDNGRPQDRQHVMQFHDLFERVLWTLLHFFRKPEATLSFAQNVTFHAIEMQQRALQHARAHSAKAASQAVAKKLLQLLRRNGPSTLRELQRSTNNLRKGILIPGLEQLMEQGQVRLDADKRFSLAPAEVESRAMLQISSGERISLPS